VVSIGQAISAGPETRQGDHDDQPQKSLRRVRVFRRTAIAICAVLVAALAAMLAPAAATSGVSNEQHRDLRRPHRLFPGPVRQSAKEIEPMPEMYY